MAKSKNSYTATKGEKTKTKRSKKRRKERKSFSLVAPLKKINKALDDRRFKRISGIFLLFIALYLFFAFVSYLFSWKADQNLVINQGLFEFLFSPDQVVIENWLGKFGAWISHFFIYRGFGLASFGFILIALVIGVKQLFNFKILPPVSTTFITLTFICWTSLLLGFFSNQDTAFLGGTFGYFLNGWFENTFGTVGSFLLTLIILFTIVVIVFNPSLEFLNLTSQSQEAKTKK